jgi:hypothetical protein
VVIAAGAARDPGVGLAMSAGVKVLGIELVEAAARESQLGGGGRRIDLARAETGQQMANEGRGTTMD